MKTRIKILEATAHCIASHGIEKTSITAIAREAGVSRPLVAHYFPKKDRMFFDVIQYIAEKAVNSIEAFDPSAPPLEQLMQTAKENLEYFTTHEDHFKCFLLHYYFTSIDKRFLKINTAFTERAVARLEGFLKKHASPPRFKIQTRELAELLHSQLVSAIQKFFIIDHGLDQRKYIHKTLVQIRALIELAN